MAKRWLNECIKEHDMCQLHDTLIPKRLVYDGKVQSRAQDKDAILKWPPCAYMTLSYCWGPNGNPTVTTAANISSHFVEIPISALPRTIQDVIYVARSLDVQYLWVDAICIIQPNSSDTADWQEQAPLMGKIYSHSLCTIAASSAPHCDAGLFFRRIGATLPVHSCTIEDPSPRQHRSPIQLHPRLRNWYDVVDRGPLSSREWAMQERMLSTRILFWTGDGHHGLQWESKNKYAWEWNVYQGARKSGWETCEPPTTVEYVTAWWERSDSRSSPWADVVEAYSTTSLTNRSDKLAAIAGIARTIERATGEVYLSGVW
ncbi:HET-domain-containing protein [Aulographum hederae CBS 113979]|uniref:HET-domain-containing protein n=1 Tax=Aulographum hederae CBS 113979 TaxID=1176131 RepID=A0A6G1GJ30_9PEZI|nr:HET-domain-containing protein [Aulographum hederae CBS 113979]